MNPGNSPASINQICVVLLTLTAIGLAGCGDSAPDPSYQKIGTPSQRVVDATRSKITQPYKNELQFVVHEISLSLSEWAWHAAKGKPPAHGDIEIVLSEPEGPASPEPTIHVEIQLGASKSAVDLTLRNTWAPGEYQPIASAILKQLAPSLPSPPPAPAPNTAGGWLEQFLDGNNLTLETENQKLSAALQSSILDPDLHEKAAVLLGLMALSENSGMFHEIHLELARATAHLSFSQAIRAAGKQSAQSAIARMASLLLLTGGNLQAQVIRELDAQPSEGGIPAAWSRILRVENTYDYRILEPIKSLRPAERQAWARAKARMTSGTVTVENLEQAKAPQDGHLFRTLRNTAHSVEVGHLVLEGSRAAELGEFARLRGVSGKPRLTEASQVATLNRLPSRTFTTDGKLQVISEGAWAMHYQRHLCDAFLTEAAFIRYSLGMPEEGTNQIREIQKEYQGLSLLPVLGRAPQFQLGREDQKIPTNAIPFMMGHPELVPGAFWHRLSAESGNVSKVSTGPTAEQWARYIPLPGTALEHGAWSLNYSTILSLPPRTMTEVHTRAPYDPSFTAQYIYRALGTNASPADLQQAWGPILEYSVVALTSVAGAVRSQPDEYERWMLKAAAIDPDHLCRLGTYFLELNPAQTARGIGHLARGFALSENRVAASHYARRLVDYYLKEGRDAEALQVAKDAASTYSSPGLATMAYYSEVKKNYREALAWCQKDDERYANQKTALKLALRVVDEPMDADLRQKLKAIIEENRPRNLTRVTLSELTTPPERGIQFREDSELLNKHGLKQGDVIVAVYGYRVEQVSDYSYLRDSTPQTNLVLIVWNGSAYQEIDATVPNKRFEAAVRQYNTRR